MSEVLINLFYYCFDILDFGLLFLVIFLASSLSALVGFLIAFLIFKR